MHQKVPNKNIPSTKNLDLLQKKCLEKRSKKYYPTWLLNGNFTMVHSAKKSPQKTVTTPTSGSRTPKSQWLRPTQLDFFLVVKLQPPSKNTMETPVAGGFLLEKTPPPPKTNFKTLDFCCQRRPKKDETWNALTVFFGSEKNGSFWRAPIRASMDKTTDKMDTASMLGVFTSGGTWPLQMFRTENSFKNYVGYPS